MVIAPKILPDEKILIARIAEGDEAAFTQMYHHYSPRIYSFVFNKTKSTNIAEEMVQEVFMKIWTMKEKITGINNFPSYLFSMVTNKTYNHLKKIATDATKLNRLWNNMQEQALDNN